MIIRAMIVDDEPPAREGIRLRLQSEPDIDLVGEYGSAREAMKAIRKNIPDLLFLDVQMPGMTGIEMLHEIGTDLIPAVILVTAFEEHALDAFEVSVVDYVLKPIDTDRFQQAMDRARTRLEQVEAVRLSGKIKDLFSATDESSDHRSAAESSTTTEFLSRFLVSDGSAEKLVDVDRVDWIEAAGDYVRLHEGDTYHLMRASMTQLEKDLDPGQFCRIHRGIIVRFNRIDEIVPIHHGDAEIHLKNGTTLRLSRSYREQFRRNLSTATQHLDNQ